MQALSTQESKAPHSEAVPCLGVSIALFNWDRFRAWTLERLDGPAHCALLVLANAHTLLLADREPLYRQLLNQADLVLNDGIGIDLCARMQGRRFVYNFNGTDLFPRLFAELSQEQRKLRVFLYGGTRAAVEGTARALQARYPAVQIVGFAEGFEKPSARVVTEINQSEAQLLLVALGNPRQERWLMENRRSLRVAVAVGVGGLFDFISGEKPRAPLWLRSWKLEWLYRTWTEPRRLVGRYFIGGPIFLWKAFRSRRGG